MIPPNELIEWYKRVGRPLPWRQTTNPYAIWLSEVMLQQTTVAAALPYYERWLSELPNVQFVCEAKEHTLLRLWEGLGYYQRAKNFQKGCRHVADYGWPRSEAEWLLVPGVGPYTAAALSSIINGEVTAVVDGNVERVFARVTMNSETGPKRTNAAREWAQNHISHNDPAEWNQAIMELGATVCRPRNPDCPSCPAELVCLARINGVVEEYPKQSEKRQIEQLECRMILAVEDGRISIVRAPSGKWWDGMVLFPTTVLTGKAPKHPSTQTPTGQSIAQVKHVVTNHKIAYDVQVVEKCLDGEQMSIEELEDVPLPAPFRKALKLYIQKNG